MSANIVEDEVNLHEDGETSESPRKRARLDNSSRKSWSLMDRRTDQEVLQEMGVSLLEPDDNEGQCEVSLHSTVHHKSLKRKRDIENVNPNVIPTSPFSPKSPRNKIFSPSPGPSRVKSPRSAEKSKPLQCTDQQVLETSLIDEYLIDEETPLAQVSAFIPLAQIGERRQCVTPVGHKEDLIINRRPKSEPLGEDSFDILSDEMILSVFRWLPKRTLANCMLVCKRWHQVACDETLWQRLDLGNKALNNDALGKILERKPLIVRLASSEIGQWDPVSTPVPSRIQYLDLSVCTIDSSTLTALLARCPLLKKLSLESVVVNETACDIIGRCKQLETLNLTMAQGITTEGLTHILKGCISLQSLNISWCCLTDMALWALVSMLPHKLQRLNIGGARNLTDDMVKRLVSRCPRLLELDLSDCSSISVNCVASICSLSRLEHLALSRCYLLPPHKLTLLLDLYCSSISVNCVASISSLSRLEHLALSRCYLLPPHKLTLLLDLYCSSISVNCVASICSLSRLEHLALSRCYLLPPHKLTNLNTMVSLQYLEVWGMLASASLSALRAALPAIQINQFMFSAIARPTVGARRTSIWGLRTRD